MFQGGYANEDIVAGILGAVPGDISIGHDIESVHKTLEWDLMGHMDLVVHDKDFDTNLIVELKLICAPNTAKRVKIDSTPDLKHIIQLATYMWMMEEPGVLVYVNRSNFVPYFSKDKIEPFYKIFYLSIKDGTVYWREEFETKEHSTDITVDGIKEFCNKIIDIENQAILPARPTDVDIHGKKLKWTKCGYCEFSRVCDNYEGQYIRWFDEAKKLVEYG